MHRPRNGLSAQVEANLLRLWKPAATIVVKRYSVFRVACSICVALLLFPLAVFPLAGFAAPNSLTAAQMASAAEQDNLTIPCPGEIFAAVDKQGKANWVSFRRDILPETSTRPQIALSLGALITDGYIDIEAQDSQGVKNVGKDILSLAKRLNVSESLLARGNSLNDFAENNQWNTLKEELEAGQNEVKLTMAEQKDQDLIILVTIGAWIRGLQAASIVILHDYTPGAAKLLRQPAIVDYLLHQIGLLPEKIQSNEAVASIAQKLAQVRNLLNVPMEQPLSPESVRQLNELATEMMNNIAGNPAVSS